MSQTGKSHSAAHRYDRVRRQHQEELAEDYVETIQELSNTLESVRVRDLCNHFGVTHVTVIRTLERLGKQNLVVRHKDGSIGLTATGKKIAQEAAVRHDLVYRFLLSLGISEKSALADAEGIEHHLSSETIAAMKKFIPASAHTPTSPL